jgi:hypothetical protein
MALAFPLLPIPTEGKEERVKVVILFGGVVPTTLSTNGILNGVLVTFEWDRGYYSGVMGKCESKPRKDVGPVLVYHLLKNGKKAG